MQTSAATSKVYKKDQQAQEGGATEGTEEARQSRQKKDENPKARFQRNFGDDDEFTTVKEKKRDNKRNLGN